MSLKQFPRMPSGMMMLEVLIALLIFSIGVLGMVKMQAVSTSNSVNSEDRATAALLANDLVTQLWTASKAGIAPSAFPAANLSAWQTQVSGSGLRGASGALAVTGSSAAITITWNRQLGRNADAGETAAEIAKYQKATYATEVTIE